MRGKTIIFPKILILPALAYYVAVAATLPVGNIALVGTFLASGAAPANAFAHIT